MHEINPATRTEINRLHPLTTKAATEAVEYAKQAIELLLNVKNQLPQSAFVNWNKQNLTKHKDTWRLARSCRPS